MIQTLKEFRRKVQKLRPRTRELYGWYLERFAADCRGRGVETWEAVTPDQVERFLMVQPWGDSSRWNACCAIRKFFAWKFGPEHPVLTVHVERHAAPPQRTLNRKQASALLSGFDTTTPKGIRDLAIVALALDTGLRAAELVGIRLKYLDMDECSLYVKVKGEDEWQPVAFFEYTESCLRHWLGVREEYANPGVDHLFVSIKGIKPGEPLTRDGLRVIFYKWRLSKDVGKLSPHDLRRTFATLAIENGAPNRAVQTAGRWKHPKMVAHYSRALEAKVLHRWSPMNGLMGFEPPPDK